MRDFRNKMREKMALLRMDEGFASRYVNDGFSGGEKKRLEMLQMAVLEPEMAILDETDSGLDIDALRIVAEGVNAMLNPNLGVLLITHYQRLLNYITPDFVHVLAQGRIITSRRQGPGPPPRGRGLRPGPARGRLRAGPARRGAARPEGARPAPSSKPWSPPARRADPMTITSEPTRTAAPSWRRDRRRSTRTRCGPTSRSSTSRSTATRWSTSTRRRRARSRASSSMPSPTTTASTTPTSIAGSTRSARRRRPSTRRPRVRSAGSSTRPTATRSSSPATRPRRSTSSPTRGAGGTSTAATRSS